MSSEEESVRTPRFQSAVLNKFSRGEIGEGCKEPLVEDISLPFS